jgi:hypothetical protein
MKIDIRKLEKEQLLELLRKFNFQMAGCHYGGYKYKQAQQKYQILMRELKRRREETADQAPEVIRRDKNNQFGIINQKYYQALNSIDQEIYVNWKWVEL